MATQVLAPRPIPGRRPLPLRTKVSYAKAMTVCIAAACGGEKPCIILCSDTRLDYGELGSTNTTAKLAVLGHSWCVQMAGDWSNVGQWKDYLKREIQTSEAANLESVAECIKDSAEYFRRSIFCEPGKSYHLLLSGFPNGKRTILSANLYPLKKGHSLTVMPSDSFACIGSGYTVASAMLSARECQGITAVRL
jgi:20S proteasome alpha/beta subunit